jgi:hypothetical protein
MFDIITCRDFHTKLKADFDDFAKEEDSARLALNRGVTAYHLHEWIGGGVRNSRCRRVSREKHHDGQGDRDSMTLAACVAPSRHDSRGVAAALRAPEPSDAP